MEAPLNGCGLPRPLTIAYLSEAWASEALRRIETDTRIKGLLKGGSLSMLTIIVDGPADRYGFIFAAFDAQGLVDYRVGHDYHAVTQGIDPPTFVVSGNYEVFAAIQRGEMTERKALISGKLHLTGSMTKALRHMKTLETITKVLAEIECKV